MESQDVVDRIRKAVPDAVDIEVSGADCDFTAIVLSPSFEGVSLVKRQQGILSSFSDVLSTGELHALSVKAHTPAEWEAKRSQSLTQLSL